MSGIRPFGKGVSILAVILICSVFTSAAEKPSAKAQNQPQPWKSDPKFDPVVDKITTRESLFVKNLRKYSPMVETYIQNMRTDKDLGSVPTSDKYFLGRVTLETGVEDVNFLPQTKEPQPSSLQKIFSSMQKLTRMKRGDGKPHTGGFMSDAYWSCPNTRMLRSQRKPAFQRGRCESIKLSFGPSAAETESSSAL